MAPFLKGQVLLDTHVVSELARPRPDSAVLAFLDAPEALLSVVVLYEMEYGFAWLPAGRRRDRLSRFVRDLSREFRDRILDVDATRAREAARIRAEGERAGRRVTIADALIAGTARTEGLPLATRNLRHFEGLDIELINPWESRRESR